MVGEIAQEQDRRKIVIDRDQYERGIGPACLARRAGQSGRERGAVSAAHQLTDQARRVVGHRRSKKAAFARLSMADRADGGNRPVYASIRHRAQETLSVRKNIALVDDDRNILTSVSMLLEAEG